LLKRVRGTPLPTYVFVAGRVGNSLVVSVLMVVLVAVIGRLIYDVSIPTERLPAVLVALGVGAFSFCCLGFALTAAIPSEDAAPAISNAVVLPLYFISGIFIPDSEIPQGVLNFADLFPIRHFFEAFFTAGPGRRGPASTGVTSRSSPPGGGGADGGVVRLPLSATLNPLGSLKSMIITSPSTSGPGAQWQLL
jgi:ABC-2 type transport system permease protein